MPGPVVLVDGANVVGSRPDGWWRDRPGAAARLVAELQPLAGAVLPGGARVGGVLVVLEGAAREGAVPGRHGTVEVRHASGSGDDLLAELCGGATLLVTADRGLAARARARGAGVAGPRWLWARLAGD